MARHGRLEDFLPENWTHADQEIIECLLLAPATPVTVRKRVYPLTIPTEEVTPGETVTYKGDPLTPASMDSSSMMTPTSDAELTQSSETTEFDRDDYNSGLQQSPMAAQSDDNDKPEQGGSPSSPSSGKRTRRTQRRKRVAPEERKIKHREVQRRFMQRKKVIHYLSHDEPSTVEIDALLTRGLTWHRRRSLRPRFWLRNWSRRCVSYG